MEKWMGELQCKPGLATKLDRAFVSGWSGLSGLSGLAGSGWWFSGNVDSCLLSGLLINTEIPKSSEDSAANPDTDGGRTRTGMGMGMEEVEEAKEAKSWRGAVDMSYESGVRLLSTGVYLI